MRNPADPPSISEKHQILQKRKSSHYISMQSPQQQLPSTSYDGSRQHNPQSLFTTWGTRHTLTLLGFLGFASSYSMRVNLSIAIVRMVNSTNHHHNHKHSSEAEVACPELLVPGYQDVFSSPQDMSLIQTPSNSTHFPTFDWSGHEQGIILGSFFYGYVATQIPGGLLSNKLGGKWVFGLGMLTTALFSLVTPYAAEAGLWPLVIVRIIQGLGEGVTNPAMHSLLASWVPASERSILGGFVYAGTQIGTVIALPTAGYLLDNNSSSALTSGWPSVFYVFGILGIIWFIFWAMLIHDSPSTHPRISLQELQYIQGGGILGATKVEKPRARNSTPWKKLLTSGPVLAILVAQTGHGWGLYTMLTELPTYMDDVLHFDIKQNSYLSALPYFLMWIVSILSSIYADKMRNSSWKTGTVRKIFNTIAHWMPALLLVFAANTACNRTLTVSLITAAIAINGAAWASFQVNHIDLSPTHAAVMMGITNGFANLCGIGAPYVAGVIINEGSSVSRWRIIFYIAAAVYFIDNVIYIMFASGETQPWDAPDDDDPVFSRGDRNNQSTPRSRYAINEDDDEEDLNTENDRSPLLVP